MNRKADEDRKDDGHKLRVGGGKDERRGEEN
jgi:hypothetical protein